MKLKFRRLPDISRDVFIRTLIEQKVITRVCEKLNIDRYQYSLFLEMFEINMHDYVSKEEIKQEIKRGKISASAAKLGLTRDVLLEDVLTLKSLNKIMEKYNLVSKLQLRNFLEYFDLDFDELVPKKDRQKIANEHRKETNLKLYGVEAAIQNKEIRKKFSENLRNRSREAIKQSNQKRQKTNLERYGVKTNLGRKEVKELIKKRYSEDNIMKNKEFAAKFGENKREKFEDQISKEELIDKILELKTRKQVREYYGLQNFQLDKLLEIYEIDYNELVSIEEQKESSMQRRRDTNLKRHGVEHNWKNDSVLRAKLKQTWLDKYNVDNPFGASEIKDKIVQTKLANGSFANSKGEKSILEYIRSFYSGEIITNSWKIIENNELDIYIPEYNLAIEFNGTYWHSMEQRLSRQNWSEKKAKNYHFNKSKLCEEKNIRLIHIFEFYWENPQKRKIYEQIIANAMNESLHKISANKCKLKQIDSKTAREFLEENHLGGFISSKINYGLYYKDELVQVEQFSKPRFNKQADWESTRGCSKLGYMIYGGYEKVIKNFVQDYGAQSIVSYVDFNIFNGRLHEKAGFNFIRYTGPDHWYLDLEGNLKRYWIVRGQDPKDLEWSKLRDESIVYTYYFAGSKTYIYNSLTSLD